MPAQNTLKLSEQGQGAVMVALTNALIQVALSDEHPEQVDEEAMDVSKVLSNYQFVLNEEGELIVLNPVIPFSISEPETINE